MPAVNSTHADSESSVPPLAPALCRVTALDRWLSKRVQQYHRASSCSVAPVWGSCTLGRDVSLCQAKPQQENTAKARAHQVLHAELLHLDATVHASPREP